MSEQPDTTNAGGEEGRAHTTTHRHRNIRSLKISPVGRFLLFLSKTDLHVLQFCTSETRMTLSSVGMMVLITGILAYFSSFFAIESTFFRNDESPMAVLIPAFISLIYSMAIVTFDREIVSATDKRAALLRIPFAMVIGFVISFPIELKLQQERIDAQILTTVEVRNAPKIVQITAFNEKIATTKEAELQPFRDSINGVVKSIKELEQARDKECLNPTRKGCGPIADSIDIKATAQKEQLAALRNEYSQREQQVDELIHKRYLSKFEEIEKLQNEVSRDKQSHDFLTQAIALHEITSSNSTAAWMSWFLRIFFVMFELFPVLIKMFLPYTEYHAYLDARRRINVNKIIGVTNYEDDEMRKNPGNIKLNRTELTDILEEVMEDRGVDFNEDVISSFNAPTNRTP